MFIKLDILLQLQIKHLQYFWGKFCAQVTILFFTKLRERLLAPAMMPNTTLTIHYRIYNSSTQQPHTHAQTEL